MIDPGTTLNHRYRILSLLGAGGMGEVYLVEDSQMIKRRLALKLMRESMVSQDEIRALKREFTFLKQLYHPNIPRVFDFGHTDEGRAYYTAEYLEGQDLGSLDFRGNWQLLIEVAVQICRALSFLHSRKLVHQDVKPQNIRIVGNLNGAFTVKLVDFGLVSARKTGLKSVKGSLETMAPEIFQDKPYDHRVDLYATGAVLFRAATGESPFLVTDIAESLKKRITEPPPSPRNIRADLPEAIDAVITKCLAPDPDNRYQSAREIIIDLSERLGDPLEPETPETLKCYIASGGFLTHRNQFDVLCKLIDDAAKGKYPGAIIIKGEQGIGKSRLIREVQTYAQLKRVAFKRVKCSHERGRALEPVLDIVRFWQDLDEKELSKTFNIPENTSGNIGFDASTRQRHLMKAVDWVESKAKKSPVILVFEDIQLAGQLTLDFLKFLLYRMNPKYLSMWFTYETGGHDPESLAHFLEFLGSHKCQQYQLHPLDEESCQALIKSMFPANCFPENFYGKLYHESGGNAFHLKLLLNALVDKSLIQLHGEIWDFTGQVQDIEHSHNLDQLFADRIRSVKGKAREVATVLGASGGSLRMSVLCHIMDCQENEMIEYLMPLIHNGWVSQYQREGHLWIGFNHPGFCAASTSDCSEAHQKELHKKIAHYLEKHQNLNDPQVQEALGHHWLKIGNSDRIAQYALPAGRAMLARLDPYAARDYWLEALSLLKPHPQHRDTVRQIVLSLAELYRDIGEPRLSIEKYEEVRLSLDKNEICQQIKCMNQIAQAQDRLGETDDAKRIWLKCLELITPESKDDIGLIYGGLGWLSFREGDHNEAVKYCREGLALMDQSAVTSQKAYLLNTLGTLCFYRGEIEDALKLWRKALKIRQKLGHQKGISDLHNNIGAALNAMGNHRGAKWHWNRCLEISQQLGDIERMGGIYNNLGIQAYEQGKLQDANRHYRQALDIFNRLGAPRDIASTLNNLGEVALMRAEYQKAMEYWQQALEIGEQMADRESQIEPLYQLGHLHILLGESIEAETRLAASESIAKQLNASGSLGSIYELLARLSLHSGDIAKAKGYSERSLDLLKRSGDQSKLARGWITRGDVAAALGDDALLKQCMNQAKKLANETGESHLKIMCFLSTLNHALNKPLDESKSKELASILKDVLELSTSFPELKWQANWVKGRFLKSKGRWKAATDAYSQSISILKQISRRLSEPHHSCYLKGKIQQQFRNEVIELKKLINE